MNPNLFHRTLSIFVNHPAGRSFNSDWFVNSQWNVFLVVLWTQNSDWTKKSSPQITIVKLFTNKKVLLCERKRHTDRSVSSIPSVILYEVGYPPVRVPPPGQVSWGVPKVGYPPSWYPPRPGLTGGYPRWGTPHWGTPPAGVDWQTKWNYYLPSRTTYAVGNQSELIDLPTGC